MTYRVKAQVAGLCTALVVACACACAGFPLINPSFEDGLQIWTAYSFTEGPNGDPQQPYTGCIGEEECPFYLLMPSSVPDGTQVCGIQSDGTCGNGGVCQAVNWTGGPATVYVTARAYSEKFSWMGGGPYDNGCRVRMGVANEGTAERTAVQDWVTFPWGDAWVTRSISIPGPGVYTVFIETYQPNEYAIMSTLWDNVVWTALPLVDGYDLTSIIPAGQDSSARIEWATDVPATSKVEYGLTTSYGQTVSSSALVTQHSLTLPNLQHTTKYHFRASSTASGRAPWVSDDDTFEMPIQFSNIAASPTIDGLGTIITWHTDVDATSQVEYGLNTSYGSWSVHDTNLTQDHQIQITGLQEDKTYHFRVWGRNQPNYSDAHSSDNTFLSMPYPAKSLANGGFESSSLYPWVQYTTDVGFRPIIPIDGIIGPYCPSDPLCWSTACIKAYKGCYFFGAEAYGDTKNGGVLQRVEVDPGTICTLGAHCATRRVGGTKNDLHVRIGIDPDGGVDPQSENIVWWSTYSPTNDNQWHPIAVTAVAGIDGIVTAFVDIQHLWPNSEMIVAVDDVKLGPPTAATIGQLKQSQEIPSAILEDEIVIHVSPDMVVYNGRSYVKAYVEEQNGAAGIAVLFDPMHDYQPNIGNKVTVTGSLVISGKEAMVVAYDWTNDNLTHALPRAAGMPQISLGGSTLNQPALYSHTGLCNVGMRVRVFGRVNWIDQEHLTFCEALAYLDDGTKILDHEPDPGYDAVYGVRVKLYDEYSRSVGIGDYLAVTGVLTLPYLDPDLYPSGDEFYAYCVVTNDKNDWDKLYVAP